MSADTPLVTVICPTMPGRSAWLAKAIACFESQDYPNKEVLLYEGPGMIGAKRNALCARSNGEIVVHFDDDDFAAPGRITDQVNRLLSTGKAVTGYHSAKFFDEQGRWWLNTNAPHWAYDASLCYRRAFWQAHPFDEINDGLEATFRHSAIQAKQFIAVDAGDMLHVSIHSGNTAKRVIGEGWREIEAPEGTAI